MYDNVGIVNTFFGPIFATPETYGGVCVARPGSRAPEGRSSQTLDAGLATPILELGNEA